MCGIAGCFSEKGCYEKLFRTLRRLEYRGYDSAGIALLRKNRPRGGYGFSVRKKRGYVSALDGTRLSGSTGIGHTRWATHGAPSDVNAHPHVAGKFALVHNGIVENYAALREELTAAGETFVSETDSEVIVRLVSRCYKGDFFAAVRDACARLEGSYAVAVLCTDFPGEIVCARKKSPLVAAAGKNALYVCSDVPALAGEAEFFCPAGDGEFIRIAGGKIFLCDGDGKEIERPFVRLAAQSALPEKGEGSFMEKEIAEIPQALADTLKSLRRTDFAPCARPLRGAKRLFAVACGTAYHAALALRDMVEEEVKIPVLCHTASEFRYRSPLIGEGDVLVAISQSGETADTLEAARGAKERGAYVVAVTNAAHSSLAALADFSLLLRAGPEIAVAATKSYVCQLLCAWYLAAQTLFFKQTRLPAWFGELDRLPEAARAALGCDVSALAEQFSGARGMYFLGRGQDVVTAMEGALKVKEIAYIFAEGYAAGELKHGTLALVEEGFPVAAACTVRALAPKTCNALAEVKARGGVTVLLSQYEDLAAAADVFVALPPLPEPLMPAVAVIPLQKFACDMCRRRGYDPDKPRNLAKSVTVE